MKSKLTIPVFILTIISFCILIIQTLFSGLSENILYATPRILQSMVIMSFLIGIMFVLFGSFILPILSIIAIYKTYKNKLEGKILAIISFILSLINLGITLTILENSQSFFS